MFSVKRIWLMLLCGVNVKIGLGCGGKAGAPKDTPHNTSFDWPDEDVYESFYGIQLDSAPVPPKPNSLPSQPRAPSLINLAANSSVDHSQPTLNSDHRSPLRAISQSNYVRQSDSAPVQHIMPPRNSPPIERCATSFAEPVQRDIPPRNSPHIKPCTQWENNPVQPNISPSNSLPVQLVGAPQQQYIPSKRHSKPNVRYSPFRYPVQPIRNFGSLAPSNNTSTSPICLQSSDPPYNPPDVPRAQAQIQQKNNINPDRSTASSYISPSHVQSIGPNGHNSQPTLNSHCQSPPYSLQLNYLQVSTQASLDPSPSMAELTPPIEKRLRTTAQYQAKPKELYETLEQAYDGLKEKNDKEAMAKYLEYQRIMSARYTAKMKQVCRTVEQAYEALKEENANVVIKHLEAKKRKELLNKLGDENCPKHHLHGTVKQAIEKFMEYQRLSAAKMRAKRKELYGTVQKAYEALTKKNAKLVISSIESQTRRDLLNKLGDENCPKHHLHGTVKQAIENYVESKRKRFAKSEVIRSLEAEKRKQLLNKLRDENCAERDFHGNVKQAIDNLSESHRIASAKNRAKRKQQVHDSLTDANANAAINHHELKRRKELTSQEMIIVQNSTVKQA